MRISDWSSDVCSSVLPNGTLTGFVGAQSTGMGHETTLAQIVADGLHLPPESVRIVEGDSDSVPFGRWTSGSRSAVTAGTALWRALEQRSEERRVGQEGGSTCRSRWSPAH